MPILRPTIRAGYLQYAFGVMPDHRSASAVAANSAATTSEVRAIACPSSVRTE